MQFLQSVHLNWLLMCHKKFYFIPKEGLYGGQIPKFLLIGKLYSIFIFDPIMMCFLLLNGLCYVLSVVCQQFPLSFRNNVLFVLMLVSSYWLKTVYILLVWNGVQGELQKGCLETTVRYGSMCKKGLWQCQKYYVAWLADPRYWGPRLQPT